MDCSEARLLMGPHLHSCPACRAETGALTRTWNALESLPDAEVPARVWDRIRANLPVPGRAPRPSFWPATAGTAALGLVVSILAAPLLPYERAVALCSEGLRGVLATSLPDPAVFFAVGFLYGLLPLGAAALVASCRLPHWAQWEGRPGIASGLVFSGLALPYAIIACSGLPVAFIGALVAGIVAGALAGGPGGVWAGGRFLSAAKP